MPIIVIKIILELISRINRNKKINRHKNKNRNRKLIIKNSKNANKKLNSYEH
jgi:hypothetical protein